MKSAAKEYGHLANAISKMPHKPVLDVRATMMHGDMMPDRRWQKTELKRLRKEIKATNDHISNWNAQDVSDRALKSLKTDLAMKKARLMELEATMEEKDTKGEEGADDDEEGSAVGGPYEVIRSGNKWLTKNMDTGHVKGTHTSRKKAMSQFRLLEAIDHGWKPTRK